MSNLDKSITELLLQASEELTPLHGPKEGELVIMKRKYGHPSEALLQERYGIWFMRDLTMEHADWVEFEYYIPWRIIWKKYGPLHKIRIDDAPLESLEELIEIISYAPASDI